MTVDVNEPSEETWQWSLWALGSDNLIEARAGGIWGLLEFYGAVICDRDMIDDSPTITSLRAYVMLNAIDAELVTRLVPELKLPEGALYAGLYPGWRLTSGDSEFGWLVGGRLAIKETETMLVKFVTEYQQDWRSLDDATDDWTLLFGAQIVFK